MSTEHFARGAHIYRQDDRGDCVYITAHGRIKREQRGHLIAVLGPGQIFGELSLIGQGTRETSAVAMTDATTLRLGPTLPLHPEQTPTTLDSHPALWQGLLGQLARRLRSAHDDVTNLVSADVLTRVAKALIDLAERFGVPQTDPHQPTHANQVVVSLGLTQTDIAHLVGARRDTVNKTLATLVARGLIRPARRSLTILDVDALRRLAG